MEENSNKSLASNNGQTVDEKNHKHLEDGKRKMLWIGAGLASVLIIAACIGICSGRADARRRTMFINRVGSADMMVGREEMMGRGNKGGFEQGARGSGGRRGMMQGANENSLGTSGDVTKISGNTITLNDGEQDIQVNVSSSTSYIKRGKVAKQSDLVTGNSIMAVGTSDSNGVVTATRIIIR